MLSLTDIVIRLFVAAVIGCSIGLNRFAHHRFIGVRTLGLVALGAAGLVVAALETGSGSDQLAAVSRIIQGIVTGIGFLCAGTIIRAGDNVFGITTAATLWIVSGIGTAVGAGSYSAAVIVTVIVFIVMIMVRPLERKLSEKFKDLT